MRKEYKNLWFLLAPLCLSAFVPNGLLSDPNSSLELVECKIASIVPDPSEPGWLILIAPKNLDIKSERPLRGSNKSPSKILVAGVGEAEGKAVGMAYSKLSSGRPGTHELFASTLKNAGLVLESVVIHTVSNNTFYARLDVKGREKKFSMDCRPSDGIALVLRLGGKIYVLKRIFEQAGVNWPPTEEELKIGRRIEPL